jgi:sulfate permease, SulP family
VLIGIVIGCTTFAVSASRMSADAYERLKQENSALAQALLTYIVRVMAERLSFASRVIGVLRR